MGACYSDGPSHCRDSTLKLDQPLSQNAAYKVNGSTFSQQCYLDEAVGLPLWANQESDAFASAEFSSLSRSNTLPAPPCFLAMRPMMSILEHLLPPSAPDWMHNLARVSKLHDQNTDVFKLHEETKATLQCGYMREAVRLPRGIDRNEWLASQTMTVFEEVFQLVSLMGEVCTPSSCPSMRCGKHAVFKWEGARLSAVEYMRALVEYAEKTLSTMIPKEGEPFPDDFFITMQKLHTRFYRVYAHAYIHHYQIIKQHDADAHLNCCFKHILYLTREFKLIPEEDIGLLRGLVDKFEAVDTPCTSDGYNAHRAAPAGAEDLPVLMNQSANKSFSSKHDPRRGPGPCARSA